MTITWSEMRQKAQASGYFSPEQDPSDWELTEIPEGAHVLIMSGAMILGSANATVEFIERDSGIAMVSVYGHVKVPVEALVLDE